MRRHYVAVDLGAESGRVVVGSLGDNRLELLEVHRFANRPVRTPDGLHWNVLGLFEDILYGLGRAAADADEPLVSIGVDSWGVDYGLCDGAGRLLGNPYHYRDSRTDGMRESYAAHVCARRQYARTGIAQLPFNTLYQLAAQARDDRALEFAESFLMIPDLMHFWLSGVRCNEYTNASTTGALDVAGCWAADLLAPTGVPQHIFAAPLEAATVLGPARPELDLGPRGSGLSVALPPTHDTACAVLAAPLQLAPRGEVCAFISSGTWSLLGLELAQPILSEAARAAGFTNERGVAGSVRFLRNIMGLWLVQESRRAWRRDGDDLSYEDLCLRCARIPSPGLVIDVDDPDLLHPADMPAALNAQLERSGQRAERDPVRLTRAIFEGLALCYRRSIADAERLAQKRVGAIAVVGGGARNALLCQLTADACERVVYAGPPEASATGNVLMQAVADKALAGLSEIRAFVQTNVSPRSFEPQSLPAIDWTARAAAVVSARISQV